MKNLILPICLFSFLSFAQTPQELQKQIDSVKDKQNSYQSQLLTLQNEIQAVKTENIYYKQVLDINSPVLEQSQNDINVKITKLEGNRADKTITITFLLETDGFNKRISFGSGGELIDPEGNAYKLFYDKNDFSTTELAINVPIKKYLAYKEIQGEPLIVKLFRFNTESNKGEFLFDSSVKSKFEFRDLKVDWK